ncbi:NUDIX domain-containing protein [Campylobacter portucalensis]|nr:NUDIX hydrolase [Campylobacter portucalensis]
MINLRINEIKKSKYIKLYNINLIKNGKEISWEYAEIHDSVSTLLYDENKKSFLLVKQIRIPLLYKQIKNNISSKNLGYTYELCSGLMDKNLSEKETAIEEILEETGFCVKNLEKIATFHSALGTSATKQTFFYAQIDDSMKIGKGGGIDGEEIELFYLPIENAREFLNDDDYIKPASLGYCFMWWFDKFGFRL